MIRRPTPQQSPAGVRRFAGSAALAAGLVLGLTACSSTPGTPAATGGGGSVAAAPSSTPGPTGAPQAVANPGLTQGLALPLEAYMETYPEQAAIARAQVKLQVACMAKFGFTYMPPPIEAPLSNDDANMSRRYGISDPDQAAQFGYHLANYTQTRAPQAQLSNAEMAVLEGYSGSVVHPTPAPSTYNGVQVPKGGCVGSINTKLGARLDTSPPARLAYDSLSMSQAKPAVQAALHAWSGCMKSKGYTVDTPFNAAALASSSSEPSPSSQEIAVAVADVACKQKTDLVKIWFTAESAIQNQQIEKNQLTLTHLRHQIDAAVKAAAAIG